MELASKISRNLCWSMILKHCFGIAVAVALFFQTGCWPENRFPEPFFIATRPAFLVIEGPGQITLEAKCRSGEQLLGGGYQFEDLGPEASFNMAVLATYPSSENSWTVVIDNPDGPLAKYTEGTLVGAFAYCLTTPNYPVGIITVTAQTRSASNPFMTPTATCPAESVLTGGGYRTGATGVLTASYNANVMMSAPSLDSNEKPTGWQVGLAYILNEMVPPTTVYALCSTKNLVAGPPVIEQLDLTQTAVRVGIFDLESHCPPNTFTTGGGYSLAGDALIPHPVFHSQSRDQYSAWKVRPFFGVQIGYKTRPCDRNLNPDCGKISAIAACVQVPNIPFVKVKITSPKRDEYFRADTLVSANVWETMPITFAAEAFDEAGNQIDGPALQWYRDGILIGSGKSFTTKLLVGGTTVAGNVEFVIRVTATGKSTSASDQIKIKSGEIL